jgi:hypothetical protein
MCQYIRLTLIEDGDVISLVAWADYSKSLYVLDWVDRLLWPKSGIQCEDNVLVLLVDVLIIIHFADTPLSGPLMPRPPEDEIGDQL